MNETAEPRPASFLSLRGVTKRFGGVTALQGVDFACSSGSVHAVLGENGAGKSTLIKIVAGVVRPDAGVMTLDGREVAFAGPAEANAAGVVCIFQELSLVQDLTVADNISLADPPRRAGLIDRRAQRRRAEAALANVGCEDVNPRRLVRDLPLSRRQMVEIAKALVKAPRLLILDEATFGAHCRGRGKGLRPSARAARPGRSDSHDLAPDARDRGRGGHVLGLPQRNAHREPFPGPPLARRDRHHDDRQGHRGEVPAQAAPAPPPRPASRCGA
jgi:ABC-type branched-subunit amino acid transport system ATPase component